MMKIIYVIKVIKIIYLLYFLRIFVHLSSILTYWYMHYMN